MTSPATSNTPEKPTMYTRQAAAILDVHPRRVLQLIAEEKLEAERIEPYGWWKITAASVYALRKVRTPGAQFLDEEAPAAA